MPRRRLPARLYLRRGRGDRSPSWVILDGQKEVGTGAGANERGKAEKALQSYLAERHRPPRGADKPADLLVTEVISTYLLEHAPTRPSAEFIGQMCRPIIEWWADKSLAEISGKNCRSYVAWRTSQRVKNANRMVSDQTARYELVCLRAAVNFYPREHGPLQAVPAVTMPPKASTREDYFLGRDEIAKRIRAASKRPETRHIARLILVGLYSGTRPGAMLRLRWLPSTSGGWVDVDNEVIHRRGSQDARTKKRQPPVCIYARLLPHLRRWRKMDMAHGITNVIHFWGRSLTRVHAAWQSIRTEVGNKRRDSPHVLRHSSATLFMASGEDVAMIAGFLGMSTDTLMETYGHHHPQFQERVAQATPKKQTNRKRTG